MQNQPWLVVLLLLLMGSIQSTAQGPPITTDKPIMLGANNWIIKSLTEIRKTDRGTFVKAPLMIHYLPTSNSLVAVHLPLVTYNFQDGGSGQTLGDVELLAKYQFYRKDGMGKTFRMVAKTLQTLPTGKALDIDGISTGNYHGYLGIVAGYESIKYGISNELGFNLSPSNDLDEFRYKLGFGLPLLPSVYPVKQINLYFEYQNSWYPVIDEFMLLYAQGIQYAKGRVTVEASIQFPLVQDISEVERRKFSVFLGTRYVF